MARKCKIIIDECEFEATRQDVKRLKFILDKLEMHYILDHVSFHNPTATIEFMKIIHNVKVWKVEKDGSVSLTNRFGHSGRFEYRYLYIPSLLEFQIVDLSILSVNEADFLDQLIYKLECMYTVSSSKRK